MALKFETLDENHNRINFDCGEEALTLYLTHFARQDMRRGLARTFIIKQEDDDKVLGYYSLCSGAIDASEIQDSILKKLPKYPIPVARLARLAVDKKQQAKGYGELLIIDAFYRTSFAGKNMGIHGIVVDAKHEKAKQFYQQYGFQSISLNPLLLFASLKELKNKFIS